MMNACIFLSQCILHNIMLRNPYYDEEMSQLELLTENISPITECKSKCENLHEYIRNNSYCYVIPAHPNEYQRLLHSAAYNECGCQAMNIFAEITKYQEEIVKEELKEAEEEAIQLKLKRVFYAVMLSKWYKKVGIYNMTYKKARERALRKIQQLY
jgi:hypothetical protein